MSVKAKYMLGIPMWTEFVEGQYDFMSTPLVKMCLRGLMLI